MKNALLILLSIISFYAYSGKPSTIIEVADTATPFGVNLSANRLVLCLSDSTIYRLDEFAISTKKLSNTRHYALGGGASICDTCYVETVGLEQIVYKRLKLNDTRVIRTSLDFTLKNTNNHNLFYINNNSIRLQNPNDITYLYANDAGEFYSKYGDGETKTLHTTGLGDLTIKDVGTDRTTMYNDGSGLFYTRSKTSSFEAFKVNQTDGTFFIDTIPHSQSTDTILAYDKNTGKVYTKDMSYKDGYMNYADSITAITPIAYTTGSPLKLDNDGKGDQTQYTYKPSGITDLYDTINHQFDFSELNVGDEVFIRFNIDVTTTAPNQEFYLYLSMAVGGVAPYTISDGTMQFKTAGTRQVGVTIPIYIGSADTKNFPAELMLSSDANASIKIGSYYISTKRRF